VVAIYKVAVRAISRSEQSIVVGNPQPKFLCLQPQTILKDFVFFLRLRAISEKEFLAWSNAFPSLPGYQAVPLSKPAAAL
jgi:hypothetical protein